MNEAQSLDLISRIYFLRDHTLFLMREARESVRFLTSQNPCNPEAIISFISLKH
jgi:hypothetical protein